MLKIHSQCVFTRTAIRALTAECQRPDGPELVVLDSAAFHTIKEMHLLAMHYIAENHDCRLMVILNDRFVHATRQQLRCGVHVTDSLSRWRQAMLLALGDIRFQHDTLRCLEHYSGQATIPERQQMVMSLISYGFSVPDIATMMKISEKTVYGHATKLREIFFQPNLNYLYRFLEQCRIPEDTDP